MNGGSTGIAIDSYEPEGHSEKAKLTKIRGAAISVFLRFLSVVGLESRPAPLRHYQIEAEGVRHLEPLYSQNLHSMSCG